MPDITVKKGNGGAAGEVTAPVVRRELEPFRLMRELLGWDPFREMAPMAPAGLAGFAPAFEVKETNDSFVFKADLPGMQEKDLEVTVTGNRLNISGKRESEREEKDEKGERYYVYERSYGSFTRSFTLPDQVDTGGIKADLKGGELTLVVPKTAAAVAKKISVSSGDKPKQ